MKIEFSTTADYTTIVNIDGAITNANIITSIL